VRGAVGGLRGCCWPIVGASSGGCLARLETLATGTAQDVAISTGASATVSASLAPPCSRGVPEQPDPLAPAGPGVHSAIGVQQQSHVRGSKTHDLVALLPKIGGRSNTLPIFHAHLAAQSHLVPLVVDHRHLISIQLLEIGSAHPAQIGTGRDEGSATSAVPAIPPDRLSHQAR